MLSRSFDISILSNKAKLSRAGRIFIKPYLSTADRHVIAILSKEHKALFDEGAHKLVKIRKKQAV